MDEQDNLLKVTETHEIMKNADGTYTSKEGADLSDDTLVSMNMWGVTPEFIGILQKKFVEFLRDVKPEDLTAEYLLPTIMDELLQSGQATVKVLSSSDRWFGVTYVEDKDGVEQAFKQLVDDGVYGETLWADR